MTILYHFLDMTTPYLAFIGSYWNSFRLSVSGVCVCVCVWWWWWWWGGHTQEREKPIWIRFLETTLYCHVLFSAQTTATGEIFVINIILWSYSWMFWSYVEFQWIPICLLISLPHTEICVAMKLTNAWPHFPTRWDVNVGGEKSIFTGVIH